MNEQRTSLTELAIDRMQHSSTVQAERDNMKSADPERYLRVGREPVSAIARLLDQNELDAPTVILDYASGWGRVTRHFRSAFPDASITCLDIWRDAVEFCASNFGDIAIPAAPDLSTAVGGPFDVVWSGSLITHLPEQKALTAINLMADAVAPNGLLVFTTHGRYVLERARSGRYAYNLEPDVLTSLCDDFDGSDYSFVPYDGQTDYGISLTRFRWISAWVESRPDLTMRGFSERGWDKHQDLVAVQKVAIHP